MSNATNHKYFGFISYARIDDQELGGEITSFHQKLEGKLKQLTGLRELRIFFDQEIKTGTVWSKEISDALEETVFFVFFATPTSVMSSPQCEKELRKFLKRERNLARKDLFFPIRLIPLLDANRAKGSFAAKILNQRQVADWTVLSDLTGDARKVEYERLTSDLAAEIAEKIMPLPIEKVYNISPMRTTVTSLLLMFLSGPTLFFMASFKSHDLAELCFIAGVFSGILFTPLARELHGVGTPLSPISLMCLLAPAGLLIFASIGAIQATTPVGLSILLVGADLLAFFGLYATARAQSRRQAAWRWAVSWISSALVVAILAYATVLFEDLGNSGPWGYLTVTFVVAVTICVRNTEISKPEI